MTQVDVVKLIQALPEANKMGDHSFWNERVPQMLAVVIDEIVGMHDWDFAVKTYSDMSTVPGQVNYTITGKNNDLRDILNISYGGKILQKMRPLDADDALDEGATLGGVKAWYSFERSTGNFPIVTIFDTPAEAKTLKIRYRILLIGYSLYPFCFLIT